MISKITEEVRCHRNIYTALVVLHIALLITNGFGTGFQNPPTEFEVDLSYGAPIDQDIGQTISYSTSPPSTEIILTNQTPYFDMYCSYLPVDDCGEIEFNATIEVLHGTPKVYMWLALYSPGDHVSVVFNEIVPIGFTTITLQITEEMTQSMSWRFVDEIEAGITPCENMQIPNFCGTAKFSRPPCQVAIDIMSTDNVSIANFFANGSSGTTPMLNLTQEDTNSTYRYLHFWGLSDGPIFLEPGNYSGFACWGALYPWPNTPVELEIAQGQSANWIIRILAVRVDMFVEPKLSSYSINIERAGGGNLYSTLGINASLPEAVYISPLNRSIEISGSVSSQQDIIYFPHVPHASIFVNGSYNLIYTLRYPYLLFQNIVFTPYQIALLLYLPALTYLVIARVVIMIEPSGPKRTWLNPRIIPVLAMSLLAATPWFFASQTELAFFDDVNYSVFRAYFYPFFYQTTWADGSSAIAFSKNDIVSLTLPIVFFWIPLISASAHIRTEDLRADASISATLLSIIFFGGAGWLLVSAISDSLYIPGPGLILASLTWLLWIVGLRLMKAKRDGTNRSES